MDDTNSTNTNNNNTNNNNTEEQEQLPPNWRDTWKRYVRPANVTDFIRLARHLLRNDPECEELGHLGILGDLYGYWSVNDHDVLDLALYEQLLDVLGTKLTSVAFELFDTARGNVSSTRLLHFILETFCLPKFPKLQGLCITGSDLGGLSGSKLGDLLCAGGLHWLSLNTCDLTLDFLQQWKRAVLACPRKKCRLSKLDLTYVDLQDGQSAMELWEIVKLFPHLEVLRFSPCERSIPINDQYVRSLVNCIDALPRLKQLELKEMFSNVANGSIEVFFRRLSKKQDLERLDLEFDQALAAGPAQDVLVETVASLPALKTFRLQAQIDCSAKFLSSLLERLIQRQSKLTSLVISTLLTATFMDECWFQWIPHLGPHFQNIEIDIPDDVGLDHPLWPNLISSMRKNGYLLNFSTGGASPAELSQICRRNKLLAQVKEKGCLSPAETTTTHQQQWAFLLEGMANRKNILDLSPLFSFVRYNSQTHLYPRPVVKVLRDVAHVQTVGTFHKFWDPAADLAPRSHWLE